MVLLPLTFSFASTANNEARDAGRPVLELGPVRLLAGMPREQVIASLAESYTISPWKNPEGVDTWGVANRSGNHPMVGYVSFEAGKLVRAGRYWPQSGLGYDVVHTVSILLERFREEGFSKCTVSARKENRPEGDHDISAINCGLKGISLDASLNHFQGEQVAGVDAYEEIIYSDPGRR